jgi:hypothetical protein
MTSGDVRKLFVSFVFRIRDATSVVVPISKAEPLYICYVVIA